MLVLGRQVGERIRIGDDVTIEIVRVQGRVVRVGITAPRELRIIREEIDDVRPKASSSSLTPPASSLPRGPRHDRAA